MGKWGAAFYPERCFSPAQVSWGLYLEVPLNLPLWLQVACPASTPPFPGPLWFPSSSSRLLPGRLLSYSPQTSCPEVRAPPGWASEA